MERYLRVNLLGLGPRLIKKEFTGPRSRRLRNSGVHYDEPLNAASWTALIMSLCEIRSTVDVTVVLLMDVWDLTYFDLGGLARYCCVPADFSLGTKLWYNFTLLSPSVQYFCICSNNTDVMLLMRRWMWDLLGTHLVCPYAFVVSVHIFCSIDWTNSLMCVVMHRIFNLFHVLCTRKSVSLFECWHFCGFLRAHLKHNRADPLPPSSVHVIIYLFIQQLGSLLF